MNIAHNARNTSTATLGRIMSCYADGDRALELHIGSLCTKESRLRERGDVEFACS